jgi:hypothetical protein
LRLVTDPALRRQLGEAGRRLIEERFTTASQYGKYGDLYDRFIERRSQGVRSLLRRREWEEAIDLARIAVERCLPV